MKTWSHGTLCIPCWWLRSFKSLLKSRCLKLDDTQTVAQDFIMMNSMPIESCVQAAIRQLASIECLYTCVTPWTTMGPNFSLKKNHLHVSVCTSWRKKTCFFATSYGRYCGSPKCISHHTRNTWKTKTGIARHLAAARREPLLSAHSDSSFFPFALK